VRKRKGSRQSLASRAIRPVKRIRHANQLSIQLVQEKTPRRRRREMTDELRSCNRSAAHLSSEFVLDRRDLKAVDTAARRDAPSARSRSRQSRATRFTSPPRGPMDRPAP
jgi:hypothetical protein